MTITTHRPTVMSRSLRTLAAAAVVTVSLLVVSLPAGAQTTSTEPGAGPTAAFCEAWAAYQKAQDGAQLNTALGAMQEALTPDAPDEVAEALVTLGQGDLDPSEVLAASDTVAAWADEPCAAQSTTTTAPPSTETSTSIAPTSSTTTSTPTSSTTAADSDEGPAPTGGVDTGGGGTATDSGPNRLVLGVTIALVAGGAGAAVAANRRRPANRP